MGASNLNYQVNTNINVVDQNGNASPANYCNATPSSNWVGSQSTTELYYFPIQNYTAVNGESLPEGGTCEIIGGSQLQVYGGPDEIDGSCIPNGMPFPVPCLDYRINISSGASNSTYSEDGITWNTNQEYRYTHTVTVLYSEPIVKGCTSSTACNFCAECNTECDAGNNTCCNEPNLQEDYQGNLCDTNGCNGTNTSTIYGPDGFDEFHCTDSDGADNSCCPDHNNSGLCDPSSSSLSSYDTCSNHNGYDGIDYWIPTEATGDVEGCMDSNACNYNASATWNDGTCVGDATLGCGCLNNEQAPSPDSCCNGVTYCQVGSTNPNGYAYYSDASYTTCAQQVTCGCTDDGACNYDSSATSDDGSCITPQTDCGCNNTFSATPPSNCWSEYTSDTYGNETGCLEDGDCFGSPAINYCTDSTTVENGECSTNCYYLDYTNGSLPGDCSGSWSDDGSSSCGLSAGGSNCTSSEILQTINVTCNKTIGPSDCDNSQSQGPFYQCVASALCNTGCTDTYADNYDPSAYIDDNSCVYDILDNLSPNIIITEFFPQVSPGNFISLPSIKIPDYVEISNVSNSNIDVSSYYIDTMINGERKFAPLSGVSGYTENNNNGFIHNATLHSVSNSSLQTQYCDDPSLHWYWSLIYDTECNNQCSGECITVTHGGKFVIFSNNESNSYGTIKGYGNGEPNINLGDITLATNINASRVEWESNNSDQILPPLNISFTDLDLTNQNGDNACITIWDNKPPHRNGTVVCDGTSDCTGNIVTQVCYGDTQGNPHYPSVINLSGQLGEAVQYNNFFGYDQSQYTNDSNWDSQGDWDNIGDLDNDSNLWSTPQASSIFNFFNFVTGNNIDVLGSDWVGTIGDGNFGSPFSANVNYNPVTISTCTERNAINFICDIPCGDSFWIENGINHLCGIEFGDICYNDGYSIPSYIINDHSDCQFEIVNDCSSPDSLNYFCDTCYDVNTDEYCNDYCEGDGGAILTNCYQYYCSSGDICINPDADLIDSGTCGNYIPCTLTNNQSCVGENGSCLFPVELTFGSINKIDTDCGGCQTVEILVNNSLPIHDFSPITFENTSDESLIITHVILSNEAQSKNWNVGISSGQVSITNDDESVNTISPSYVNFYDFTPKLIYKIGFSTDVELDTDVLRMQIDGQTILHDVANNEFISILSPPELIFDDTLTFDCDGYLYDTGNSHTIQDNCGICVEFGDNNGDDINDLGCWYSLNSEPCNPTDDTADNYCSTATCDGVPNGNSTTDCSVNGTVECCCPDDGSVCHTGTPLCSTYDECGVCNGGGMAAQCTASNLTFGNLEGNCCDSNLAVDSCTIGVIDCAGVCDGGGTYDLCGVCNGGNASMDDTGCNCCPPDANANAGQCTTDGGSTWYNYSYFNNENNTFGWNNLTDCNDTCFGTFYTDTNCSTCTETDILQDCALNCEYLADGNSNSAYLGYFNGLDGNGYDACGTCPNLYPESAGDGNFCNTDLVPSVSESDSENDAWSHCYHWNGSPGCFDCAGKILTDTDSDGYGDTNGEVTNSFDVCSDCTGPNAGINGAADLGCGCDVSAADYTLYDDSDNDGFGCGSGDDGTFKVFCETVNSTNYVIGSGDGYANDGTPCLYTQIYTYDNSGCYIQNNDGNPKWIDDNTDEECACNPNPDATNLDTSGLDCTGECNGPHNENVNGCCLDSERDCQGNCPNCNVTDDGYECIGEGHLTDETYNCTDGSSGAGCDCAGVCAGAAALDNCDVCNGGNVVCTGCMDVNACNTGARADGGGQCTGGCDYTNGNATDCDYTTCCNNHGTTEGTGTCDCDTTWCPDGTPGYSCLNAGSDECGVCGGDNSSCLDCGGTPNGPHRYDFCSQCLIDPGQSNVCNDGLWNTSCTSANPDCPFGNGQFYECIQHPHWNQGPNCCSGNGLATGNEAGGCGEVACSDASQAYCDCTGSGTGSGTVCPDGINGCTQAYDDCNNCGGDDFWLNGNYEGDMGCNHICASGALTDGCGNCQYLESGTNPNILYYGTDGTDYGINGVVCDYNDLTDSGGCPQGCNEGDCPHWAESGVCADCAEDLDGTLVEDDCLVCGGNNNQTSCITQRDGDGWVFPTDNLTNPTFYGDNLDCNCSCATDYILDICGECNGNGSLCIPSISLDTINEQTNKVKVYITNSQYVGQIVLLINSENATIDSVDTTEGLISNGDSYDGWGVTITDYAGDNRRSISVTSQSQSYYIEPNESSQHLLTLNITPTDNNNGKNTPYWVEINTEDSEYNFNTRVWYDNTNIYEYPTVSIEDGYDEIHYGCLDPYSNNCLSITECGCVPGEPLSCVNHHLQSTCNYPTIGFLNGGFEFPEETPHSYTDSLFCTLSDNSPNSDDCLNARNALTSSFTLNPYGTAGSVEKKLYTDYTFSIDYNFEGVYQLLSSPSADISSYVKYTFKSLTSNNYSVTDYTTSASTEQPVGDYDGRYVFPESTYYDGGYCPGFNVGEGGYDGNPNTCPSEYKYYPEDEDYLLKLEWPHDWHDTNDPMTGTTFTEPRISAYVKFTMKKSGCADTNSSNCNYLVQATHDCIGELGSTETSCCEYEDITGSQTGIFQCCLGQFAGGGDKDQCGFCPSSGDVGGVNWGYNLGEITYYENSDNDTEGCLSDTESKCPHLAPSTNYFALDNSEFCDGQFSYPGSGGFNYLTHCGLTGLESECSCGDGLYSQATANSPSDCPSCVSICMDEKIIDFSGVYSDYLTSTNCASTDGLGAQVFGYCVDNGGTGYCHYVDDCGLCFNQSYSAELDNEFNYIIYPGSTANPSRDCAGTCYNQDGFGSYTFDTCEGECVGGNSGYLESDYQDECNQCGGVCNSVPACENSLDCDTAEYYSCYFINSCYDCTGELGGNNTFDACGICGGNNEDIGGGFVIGPDADCAGNCYGNQESDDFGNCCDMTSSIKLYPDLDLTSTTFEQDCISSFTGCSGEVGFCTDGDGDITLSGGVYTCSSGEDFILTNTVQICLVNAPATNDTPVNYAIITTGTLQQPNLDDMGGDFIDFTGNYYSSSSDWCVGFGPDSCSDCWDSYDYYNLNLDCNGNCDGTFIRDDCGYCDLGSCVNGGNNGNGCGTSADCFGSCLDSATSSCVGGTSEGELCTFGDDTSCTGDGICLPDGYNASCTGCMDPSADNITQIINFWFIKIFFK